jgi:uncharacterized protein (TIGR02679 family)
MADLPSGEGWRRLLAAARRRLERTGGALDGKIGLVDPSDAERHVVIGLTGRHRPPGTARLAVSLAELDSGLRRSAGAGLVELLARTEGPLRDRRAEAAAESGARDTALAALAGARHENEPWYAAWREELVAGGALTRLVRRGDQELLGRARVVLDRLPADGVPLPVLAEEATGDPKALSGTTLATLVLRALALRYGVEPPDSAAARRELWESAGVVVDDLASQILVLNLPAAGAGLGDWLTDAAERGVPMRLTLHQLTAMPPRLTANEVFVCENPAILRAAAARLGPRSAPVVCTEGVPSLACWRLLDGVARIHWRNDFDWAGLRMTQAGIDRLGAVPWRMSAADYRAALDLGDTGPLRGTVTASPWDPELATALAEVGRSVMEERLLPVLLADLGESR